MSIFDPNQLKLADSYSLLKQLRQNPEQNAALIAKLQVEIRELEALLTEGGKPAASTYLQELGVFLTPEQQEAWKKAKDQDVRDKKKHELSGSAEESQYSKADRFCQTQPLGTSGWYNTKQLEALTQQRVPVGSNELAKFLKNSDRPVSFCYLIEDKKHPEHNHFVSIAVDRNNNVIYVDSNGDKMPDAERGVFGAAFNIHYLNTRGDIINEKQAALPSSVLARVQYDNHNCGMYSASLVNMMRDAACDPEKIKVGLAAITKIDPVKERQAHESYLRDEQAVQRGAPYHSLAVEANIVAHSALQAGIQSCTKEAADRPYASSLQKSPYGMTL